MTVIFLNLLVNNSVFLLLAGICIIAYFKSARPSNKDVSSLAFKILGSWLLVLVIILIPANIPFTLIGLTGLIKIASLVASAFMAYKAVRITTSSTLKYKRIDLSHGKATDEQPYKTMYLTYVPISLIWSILCIFTIIANYYDIILSLL